MDILCRLRSATDTGAAPELIDDAISEIERLRAIINVMRKNGAKIPIGDVRNFISADELLR